MTIDLNKELSKIEKDLDDTPLLFGKHKGLTPTQIAEEDNNYIIWMYENIIPHPCSYLLYQACCLDQDDDGEDTYLDGILKFK